MIETLKTKLQELNNLSQSLNDQLEQLRQQLDERPRFPSISSFSGSDTDVTDFMSETLSDESLFDETSNQSAQNIENNNEADAENNPETTASDVVEQVERTIVTTLFDVSSRLEVVRNQMRAVLDAGFVNDNDNLHIATPALDAIVNNNSNVGVSTSANANVLDNRDSANDLDRHSFMQVLNSLYSRVSDNADQGSEARDGDVLPEFQGRGNDDTANNLSVSHDSRDVSYSDQYANSDANHSESDLSYVDMNGHDTTVSDDEESEGHNRSFRFSSRNTSAEDQYGHDERALPEHVIVSEPPGSPSNSNSSFLTSCSSVLSYDGVSPANHLTAQPADSSTPRHGAEDDHWASNAHTTPHSTTSSHGDNTNSSTPRSHQSSPNSSPGSAHSGDNEHQNSGPEYESDSSIGSVSHMSSSVASQNSVSVHSEESVHSVTSSTSVAHTADGSHSEAQTEVHSDENGHNDDTDVEENGAIREDKWFRHRRNSDSTDQYDYEEHNETVPSVLSVSATESDKGRRNSEKPSNDHAEGTNKVSCHQGSDSLSEIQDSNTHVVSSSASTDESCHNTSHVSIPSDSSDDSDKSESIKYLTKRLRHVKKDVETPADTKPTSVETDRNVQFSTGKNDSKIAPELNLDKNKGDPTLRGRHSRKRRGATEVSFQGSQSKKVNTGASNYGSVYQSQSQTCALPSQTSGDPRLPVRRTRSSTIQAATAASDNSSQSLNVKIDLSLINYSGQVAPKSVTGSTPSATVTLSKSSGAKQDNSSISDWAASTPGHRSGSPRGNDMQGNTHRQSRYPRRRDNWTRSQPRTGSPGRHMSSHGYNTRTFPHSWIDDSDQSESSDDTYIPGSDCNETDVTITEEEAESDTSYEVQIPKTTADLLDEYGSNDSDESWTVGMD